MEIMEKYNFKSWLKGDVTLVYSKSVYHEKDNPVFVYWENFSEVAAIKIKQFQKALFDKIITQNLEKYKSNFKERYSKSSLKQELLETEKQECFNILYSKIPNKEFITTGNWKTVFEYNYLIEVQEYANRTILNGYDASLDFMHSPYNKYQIKNRIPPEAFAQLLFEYFQWLENEFTSEIIIDTKNIYLYDKNIQTYWFKVGLFFANGTISELVKNGENKTHLSCMAISKKLGNQNYRPYISESLSGTSKSDKNIFSDKNKVNFILKYCQHNNIEISDDFNSRIKE
jgi:hypothetical protein